MGRGQSKPSDSLTAEQIRQLSKSFDMFDKDRSGTVDYVEMESVLAAAGYNWSYEDISLLIDELDIDGDGLIDKGEFMKTMAKKSDGFEKEVKIAFQVFDKDQKGYITLDELREVFLSIGEEVTRRQLKKLLRVAQADGQGRVRYRGFAAVMRVSRQRAKRAQSKASTIGL